MSAPPLQFSSPMQPVAPPSKKAKAEFSIEGDETVSRRRQELQRLKEKHQMKRTPGGSNVETNRTEGLLAQARSQLEGPPTGGPPVSRSAAPPKGPPVRAPQGAPIDRVRHSDIFPSVEPKVAPRTSTEPPRGIKPPPPSRPNAPPTTQSQTERGSVARRLDPSFAQGRVSPAAGSGKAPPVTGRTSPSVSGARPKSAPPSRPPPPPGPPPLAKEAPDTTPSRGFASRPSPMTPGSTSAKPEGTPKPVETPKMSNLPPGTAPTPAPVPVPTPAPKPVNTPARPPVPAAASASKPPSTPSASSAPPSSKTPYTGHRVDAPPTDGPPTTSRKDMIRNFHQYADTPGKPKTLSGAELPDESDDSSGILRLEKELREHEREKAEALRKVAILEEQLQKLKEQGDPREELDSLIQLADREGETAAIQFARQRASGTTPRGPIQVGFFSPKSPGLATPRANHPRKRIATPHPKRDSNNSDENETEDEKLYKEAVKYALFEYTTDLASFLVRRPYGNATDKELWFKAGFAPSKQYEKKADVKKASTLEIVAQIKADGSMLSLHGESSVRHIGADVDADWVEFGNYDELDKPLGTVTYIDSDANEKDYSLDEVVEGALAARENYCTSVVSMGRGLKAKGTGTAAPPTPNVFNPAQNHNEAKPKPQTSNACVGTEDLPFEPPAKSEAGEAQDGGQVEKNSSPPPDIDEGDDLVSAFIGSFVAMLLWIVKSMVITMPMKAISFTFFSLVSFILLSLLWLQLFDDNGAGAMGASMDFMHNRPGIV